MEITRFETCYSSRNPGTVNLFSFHLLVTWVFWLARNRRDAPLRCFGSWWKVFIGSLEGRTSGSFTCSSFQAQGRATGIL